MKLREYQQRSINMLYDWLRENDGHPCLVLPTGCHERGQLIIMYDGSLKKVEDVAVGDLLMGVDSTPRKVLNLCRGSDYMYKITPKQYGSSFIVNGDHVLSLMSTNEGKKYPSNTTGGERVEITVNDYLGKSKYWKHLHKLHRSPVTFAGNYDLPIDPWLLGILLGDGHLGRDQLSITTNDREIMDEVLLICSDYKDSCQIKDKSGTSAKALLITKSIGYGSGVIGSPSYIMGSLRGLGLSGRRSHDKFIPHEYKTSSDKDRIKLLAGLMDSDGSLSTGYFDFVSKSKQLADDVAFIARSLGFGCNVTESEKSDQHGKKGLYHRVSICGDVERIPCVTERKKAGPRLQKKRVSVSGFSVEKLYHGDYYGFTLDGDSLYLLDDFTVTHNSGKSHIVASLCKDAVQNWPGTRILMLTHQMELINQNAEKMRQHWPNAPLGIYSASIGKRQLGEPITFAGIQSVRNRANELGHIDLIIIDECHLVSHHNTGGYRNLINELTEINPKLRVVGLTATPYRLGHGLITDDPAIFDDLIEPVSIEELIYKGFLAPLRSKATKSKLSADGVKKRGGEYIEKELQVAVNTKENNESIVDEVIGLSDGRKSWLFFCTGVAHARSVCDELLQRGVSAACVTGETPKKERARMLNDFKDGRITALTNANVLTTGFDAPNIDLIAMLRPTLSPSLFVQMAGRGFRVAPNKTDCLVLDFAGVVETHGPITAIQPPRKAGTGGEAPTKSCPECDEIVHASAQKCPACGFEFPDREVPDLHLRDVDIMGSDRVNMDVTSWSWRVHTSKKNGKKMLRVTYYGALSDAPVNEYITLLHDGYAKQKATENMLTIANKSGADITTFTGKGMNEESLADLGDLMTLSTPPSVVTYKKEGFFTRVLGKEWGHDDKRTA